MKKNILVFPCGSEVALEIHRSLKYNTYFNLFGASSVEDHGKFVFENYIGGLPFIYEPNLIDSLNQIIIKYNIDAIYPAMDSVITILKRNENRLKCKIISSEINTTELCLSKTKTYNKLKDVINVPIIYSDYKSIENITYPLFAKPDVGYGSRGAFKVTSYADAKKCIDNDDIILTEYLPGEEYTVDCFTNKNGILLFAGPRSRKRISNGISVNSISLYNEELIEVANKINQNISFRGAWFFQVKINSDGVFTLLEIADRLGGSSSLNRMKGVNFALLTLFDAFDYNVSIDQNKYEVEIDRSLTSKFKINIEFDYVYVDLDDTIIVDNNINTELISVLYKFINQNKKIILITKHKYNLEYTLRKYRINELFDEIIHLKTEEEKYIYIKHVNSIFIDDSFAERSRVKEELNINVYSVDMIELFK